MIKKLMFTAVFAIASVSFSSSADAACIRKEAFDRAAFCHDALVACKSGSTWLNCMRCTKGWYKTNAGAGYAICKRGKSPHQGRS
jgi:hypothetical protein